LKERRFGRTGRPVSEIGFGAWAIGASWGHVDESDALAALNHALDSGVTFIDTADVYGDGRSEQLIARVLNARGGERPFVATKAGRRLRAQEVAGYTKANLTTWINRSLRTLQTDTLDLVQLHCPPTDLYYHPEVFGFLDDLKHEGKIRDYASVSSVSRKR
jgi:aryl-alcohol dehydrogenase-like predicted oxidoreductase